MSKVQSVSLAEFMADGFPAFENVLVAHVKRNRRTYIRIAGATVAAIVITDLSGFAYAGSVSPIDIKAHKIYSRLCNIGKWVIAIRGAVEIIGKMSEGDLDGMKKRIIVYVVGFVALLGLPWLLDQTQAFFDDPAMNV